MSAFAKQIFGLNYIIVVMLQIHLLFYSRILTFVFLDVTFKITIKKKKNHYKILMQLWF